MAITRVIPRRCAAIVARVVFVRNTVVGDGQNVDGALARLWSDD